MTTTVSMRKSEVGELRPSQVLHTFGVGSIVDLPNLSVLVMGLEDWPISHSNEIGEERLLNSVQTIIGPQVSRLLTPPRAEESVGSQSNWFDDFHTIGVPVAPFPRWMVCSACRLLAPLSSGLFEPKVYPYRPDKSSYLHAICPKSHRPAPVVPARFLVACKKGHLDDFPWLSFVHRGKEGCPGPLRLYEVGPTGEASDVEVACEACNARRRMAETEGLFKDRTIAYEPVELTSRVSTNRVSEAKRRLEQNFWQKDQDDKKNVDKYKVDVAIATNMISVGLDISRLGLMVCFGQPKTSSEYIQATSRVGRDDKRPGLVITILNVHRPRDRSHYERFAAFHESFYRSVEATSVTPFSPRALDRGIAGTLIALVRQGHLPMTPPRGATEILSELPSLEFAVDKLSKRALATHHDSSSGDADQLRMMVRDRCKDLLDTWSTIAKELHDAGGALQYQTEAGSAQRLLYEFLNPDLKSLPPRHKKFRANRSMRDVEPSVNLWLKTIDGVDIEGEEDAS